MVSKSKVSDSRLAYIPFTGTVAKIAPSFNRNTPNRIKMGPGSKLFFPVEPRAFMDKETLTQKV